MAELEIRTTGELIVNLDVVGHITWTKPLIESEIAGFYGDVSDYQDEFGDPFNCSGCDDRDEALSALDTEVNVALARLLAKVREDALGDGVQIATLDEIDKFLSELRFSA